MAEVHVLEHVWGAYQRGGLRRDWKAPSNVPSDLPWVEALHVDVHPAVGGVTSTSQVHAQAPHPGSFLTVIARRTSTRAMSLVRKAPSSK